MRVCIVSQEYPPETAHGGIGTETWNKTRELVARGHQVHVLSCEPKSAPAGTRVTVNGDVTVHRMAPPGETRENWFAIYDQAAYLVGYTWQVLENLERLLKQTDFDVINFAEYGAEGFAYQLNRSEHNWRPVLVHLHGPLAMFAERVGWPDPDSRFHRIADFMEGESIRLADGLMASSANIADWTAARYGVDRRTIRVVHPGVDCVGFHPLTDGERLRERPTVLFVGNAERSKGIWTVFDAVASLRARYPEILLQIVGRGQELDRVLRAAERAGASSNVEAIGFVPDRGALPEYYRRAHVFASPALHEVGVANVYVEAMASGCPVVASSTGGAPEAVLDGETGLLVPPEDVEAAAAAIDRILGDAALRARMSVAARARAVDHFATDHYAERVLAAYHETIERSAERRARGELLQRGSR